MEIIMFLAIAAGIGVAANIAGMYETTLAEQAQIEQINIQAKQKELQLTQKKASVYDNTQKVLNRQVAQATTRGIGMNSPSFNAIQRSTLNMSSKEFNNINTESELTEYSASAEKENARNTAHAKLFGATASMAMSFASLGAGRLSGPSSSGSSKNAGNALSSSNFSKYKSSFSGGF